jgi:uncharacterized membrane protein (UPF0127 family)
MKKVAIHNETRSLKTPVVANYCDSFFSRLRGFTFRDEIPQGEGLLLVQSRDSRLDAAIHMLMVFTDLAVVWINDAGEVVDTCLARSWALAYMPKSPARFVLEMRPSRLDEFCVGDHIRFEEV